MMTPREVVKAAISYGSPDRLPRCFPETFGTDFSHTGMVPSPDGRPGDGVDEWGAVWENIGVCSLGEVKEFPLLDWADWDQLNIPDVKSPERWEAIKGARERAGDLYLLGNGISLYERVHFIRGLENTWCDIYESPEKLGELMDILVDMNLYAVQRYAEAGVDGYMWCDDWGLQDRLMISPDSWRELWKPRYAKVYEAAHKAGMQTLLHSCGYIVDILDDLIEAGLDCIQMDQQENMGMDLLAERFGGRIAFWCPVDIQYTMARGNPDEIRAYCHKMVETLGRPEGGFIPKWYPDPKGAGHTQEAIDAMCDEFMKIGG
jgi:hypothetical protein